MKRLFHRIKALGAAMLLGAGMLGMLGGCGSTADNGNMKIVTTVFATYDLAKQLTERAGISCEVKLLLTPGGESHAYEPTPSDVSAVQSCDLFVYIGGTSEKWAEKLIGSSRKDKRNLRLFDTVELLSEETVEGMEEEHEHEHEHEDEETDEHIWTAPLNADAMLNAISGELKQMQPDHADACDRAFREIHTELLELDAQAREIRETSPKDTLIFADRFPFRYLMHAYGWKYYAAFPGCSSDTDASAATLAFLIQKVKDEQIQTVFYLENSQRKIADAVCKATGANAVMLQSCNNVSKEDMNAGRHYQEIMSENLNAIREALK